MSDLQETLAAIRAMLREQTLTPEQLAETTVHALYPKLSDGAGDTFEQLGRGAVIMDLRDLDAGKLDTSYVPQEMLQRLNAELNLLDDAERAVAAYNPLSEFVVIVWQSALIMVYRLERL